MSESAKSDKQIATLAQFSIDNTLFCITLLELLKEKNIITQREFDEAYEKIESKKREDIKTQMLDYIAERFKGLIGDEDES